MLHVGIAVDLVEIEQLFAEMTNRVKYFGPVFAGPIDKDVTEGIQKQFDTQGRHWGTPWKPLSPTTIALRTEEVGSATKPRKRKGVVHGRRTVSRTGRARAGFAMPERDTLRLWAAYTKSGGPGSLRVITTNSYERGVLGSVVPYAAAQATGVSADKAKMFGRKTGKAIPARPVFPPQSQGFPAPVVNAWAGMLLRYLETGEA